ncbi:hypothetical protein D3C80_1832840 [compost metagenome]
MWKAPGFKAKLGYLFGPPGWSHDGSRKTSAQLRKELKQQQVAAIENGNKDSFITPTTELA